MITATVTRFVDTHSAAQSFWDSEAIEPTHATWMSEPAIRDYIAASVGGATPKWPTQWLAESLGGRRLGRVLSIGCGTGALERDLASHGLCEAVDAFDGSIASLRIAREEAQRAGLDRIRYFAMNFDEPTLPRAVYDAVFFHQSAHHVAKLEKLFRAVLLALKPDGFVYLDEYVGPSRNEWTTDLARAYTRAYESLPAAVRMVEHVPYPFQANDPSEAIRSSEIVEQLKVGFTITATRPYGGTLLSVAFPYLKHDQLTPALVDHLIVAEKELLANGAPSFYTVLVGRPRRGVGKLYASLTYYFVPKAKRVARELRKHLS